MQPHVASFGGGCVVLGLRENDDHENHDDERAACSHKVREQVRVSVRTGERRVRNNRENVGEHAARGAIS